METSVVASLSGDGEKARQFVQGLMGKVVKVTVDFDRELLGVLQCCDYLGNLCIADCHERMPAGVSEGGKSAGEQADDSAPPGGGRPGKEQYRYRRVGYAVVKSELIRKIQVMKDVFASVLEETVQANK
mmetsp:Transcript_28051/g.54955  ORF Transcript_28051/g.54955 Transcript_28051/m.54955 type:complete len:129 (-) Transcript_28051:47-433(-)